MNEFINKIELLGIVGAVKKHQINDQTLARFSLVTQDTVVNEEGISSVNCEWHSIQVWERPRCDTNINKGDTVHIVGMLKYKRYTAVDGSERIMAYIDAQTCKVINNQ